MRLRIQLYALATLTWREVRRFLRIWMQTLVPPAITAGLYFVIFGTLIGSRVGEMGGVDYVQFMVPGLVMMSVILNTYTNVSSSFYGSKFQKSIEELLVSPMSVWVMVGGFVLGGIVRGLLTAVITTAVALLFTEQVSLAHPLLGLAVVSLAAMLFSLVGLINGLYANNFDQVSVVPNFLLTPLIYLGGVFYSIELLSPTWQFILQTQPHPLCGQRLPLRRVGRDRLGCAGAARLRRHGAAQRLPAGGLRGADEARGGHPLLSGHRWLGRGAPALAPGLDPQLLDPIERPDRPAADAPASFAGSDHWLCHEVSALDARGWPLRLRLALRIPADSPRFPESKSLKLYLMGAHMVSFGSVGEMVRRIGDDLQAFVGAPVQVHSDPVLPPPPPGARPVFAGRIWRPARLGRRPAQPGTAGRRHARSRRGGGRDLPPLVLGRLPLPVPGHRPARLGQRHPGGAPAGARRAPAAAAGRPPAAPQLSRGCLRRAVRRPGRAVAAGPPGRGHALRPARRHRHPARAPPGPAAAGPGHPWPLNTLEFAPTDP